MKLRTPLLTIIFVTISLLGLAQTVVQVRLYEKFSNNPYKPLDKNKLKLITETGGISVSHDCFAKDYMNTYFFKFNTPVSLTSARLIIDSENSDTVIEVINGRFLIKAGEKNKKVPVTIRDFAIGFRMVAEEKNNLTNEIRLKQNQNAALRREISKVNGLLENMEKENKQLQDEKVALNSEVERLEESVQDAFERVDSLEILSDFLITKLGCQDGKMKELIEVLKSQQEKLYYSYMKMINCNCEIFEQRKRKGGLGMTFNLISTNDLLLKDSVYIQGEKETFYFDFKAIHRNPSKSDSIINQEIELVLDGSPTLISIGQEIGYNTGLNLRKIDDYYESKKTLNSEEPVTRYQRRRNKRVLKEMKRLLSKNRSIKAHKGQYVFVVRNEQGFEVGRREFSSPSYVCNKKVRKQAKFEGMDIAVIYDKILFNDLTSQFSTFETEQGETKGETDGDAISIYDCDVNLQNCILVQDSVQLFKKTPLNPNLMYNHTFNYQMGYILFKQVKEGSVQGCSAAIQVSESNKTLPITLVPKINQTVSGFKYQVDPSVWWLCEEVR